MLTIISNAFNVICCLYTGMLFFKQLKHYKNLTIKTITTWDVIAVLKSYPTNNIAICYYKKKLNNEN